MKILKWKKRINLHLVWYFAALHCLYSANSFDIIIHNCCCMFFLFVFCDLRYCKYLFKSCAALWDTRFHLRKDSYSQQVGATSSQIHNVGLYEHQRNVMIVFLYPVAKQPALFCLKPQCPERNITSLVWRVEEWKQGMQSLRIKPLSFFQHVDSLCSHVHINSNSLWIQAYVSIQPKVWSYEELIVWVWRHEKAPECKNICSAI